VVVLSCVPRLASKESVSLDDISHEPLPACADPTRCGRLCARRNRSPTRPGSSISTSEDTTASVAPCTNTNMLLDVHGRITGSARWTSSARVQGPSVWRISASPAANAMVCPSRPWLLAWMKPASRLGYSTRSQTQGVSRSNRAGAFLEPASRIAARGHACDDRVERPLPADRPRRRRHAAQRPVAQHGQAVDR